MMNLFILQENKEWFWLVGSKNIGNLKVELNFN